MVRTQAFHACNRGSNPLGVILLSTRKIDEECKPRTRNRSKFPLDELAKHWGKHVAFRPDGTRIVTSGDSFDEVVDKLQAAGIHFSQAVDAGIDGPDVDGRN